MHRETETEAGPPTVTTDRRGDDGAAAVARLFDDHARAVHAFVAHRLGPTAAPDLTAETFRIAVERWSAYDPALGAPRAWLFGIAANLNRGHWRTEQRRLRALARLDAADPAEMPPADGVDDRAVATADLARVLDAVAGLPADDRDLLTLLAWEGCSYAEIAVALGIPVGTVRSRLHRIRTVLAASRATTRPPTTRPPTTRPPTTRPTTREELGHG